MTKDELRVPVLLGLALALTYVTYLLWAPFIDPIGWAAAFAILFAPVYHWLGRYIPRDGIRAGIMTTGVILVIVVPLSVLGVALVVESVRMFGVLQKWLDTGHSPWVQQLLHSQFVIELKQQLNNLADNQNLDLSSVGRSFAERLAKATMAQATNMAQNFYEFVFAFALMTFTLFFFFRDGNKIAALLRDLIPLPPAQRQRITREFQEVVTATIVGDLVVALIQGTLGGLAFWVLGLAAPLFWGAVMTFLSVLPLIGAPLVYVPASILLVVRGQPAIGVALLLWGTIVVSQIDNVLRPVLISGRTKLPTLVLFFSLLGGIYVFGFFGIIAGPLVAALFGSMIGIYQEAMGLRPASGNREPDRGE